MIFETIAVGLLQCNCYVLGCEKTREGIVIDPGDDSNLILPLIERHRLRIRYILSTHAHIDHVGDLEPIRARTGAQAILHERDLPLYQNLPIQAAWLGVAAPRMAQIDTFVHDRDLLRFGDHSGEVLYTPGHSPGSLCFYLPGIVDQVFAGDTLFQRSIGRTDLWGGSYEAILRSIRDKLLVLDDRTVVYPGHGPATTVGDERRHNPFLNEL
ncbi:MAG TPA: MBL fold metallo-hydrolase [Terriglobia bacterium]|nr:MBL fold metallo-hydrolase [Terriglobia bacterium]